MFTGIVQGIAQVSALTKEDDFNTMTVVIPSELLTDLCITYSVAINGCCLSVTAINGNLISFDIIHETLKRTNLKFLQVNHYVNVERSARMNTEVGGHFLSGHIIDVGYVRGIFNTDRNCRMEIQLTNKSLMKYIFYKGYVGIDGISITIGKVFDDYFNVHLIPETLERTTLQRKKVGDALNIEVDSQTQVIVNTVERVLKEHYVTMPPCLCQCTVKSEEQGNSDEENEENPEEWFLSSNK